MKALVTGAEEIGESTAESSIPTTSADQPKNNGNVPAGASAMSDPCGVGAQSPGPAVVEMDNATTGSPCRGRSP